MRACIKPPPRLDASKEARKSTPTQVQASAKKRQSNNTEGPKYFLSLLNRAEEDDKLEKQVKKHGMDYGLDDLSTDEPNTNVNTDGRFTRAQRLVYEAEDVRKPEDLAN